MKLDPEIESFYSAYGEASRLEQEFFRLERDRTLDLLERKLPKAPAVVYDVGGGPGAYALWLARRGYAVHLLDAVPRHVEQAKAASAAQPEAPLRSARLADARQLPLDDASAHAVLLLGPLYHLTERTERLAALAEARRVLRPGGVVLAAAISRFASLIDGLQGPLFQDPEFERIVRRDLEDGQHRNDTGRIQYFTTAYFHRPEELRAEVEEAGLRVDAVVGLEGPGWLLGGFDAIWDAPPSRAKLLDLLRQIEEEPSLLGVSAHLVALAHRP